MHYLPLSLLPLAAILMVVPDYRLVREKKKSVLFSQNSKGYRKNHCTNTRLVCTYSNAFFMLNPNREVEKLILIFFLNCLKINERGTKAVHYAYRCILIMAIKLSLLIQNKNKRKQTKPKNKQNSPI